MFWGILGRAGILLNSLGLFKKVKEAFTSSTIPLESEWNLTCTNEERRYPFLSFLAQGILLSLPTFLNHKTVGLWYQLKPFCATEEANAVKEKTVQYVMWSKTQIQTEIVRKANVPWRAEGRERAPRLLPPVHVSM